MHEARMRAMQQQRQQVLNPLAQQQNQMTRVCCEAAERQQSNRSKWESEGVGAELWTIVGQLERVAYPWIVNKELEGSSKSIIKLNAEFEAASENACIQRSPLIGASTEDNLGVFSTSRIQQGDTIVFTRSVWTDDKTRNGDNLCSACYSHIPESLTIQPTRL